MNNWKLFKLKFGRTPVHFGELGIGMESTAERVRSDTLFSAWVSAYARLFRKQDVEELLKNFQNHPQPLFRLSSTFIYREVEGKTIYYLPCPLQRPINYPDKDFDFSKEYKKLNYLPLEVWQRWYQGEGWKDTDTKELKNKTEKLKTQNDQLEKAGTFDIGEAYESCKIPKIAVDRTTRATNLYHTKFVQYKENSGLYFLAEFSNPDWENTFLNVLHFLGEEGIGGERSSGAGQFQVESIALDSDWERVRKFSGISGKINYTLMSLFWESPLSPDLLDAEGNLKKKSSYELQKRGGWVSASPSGSQRRRQSLQMFSEGSVFPVQPQGKLADVTPDSFEHQINGHKVYRSGVSLSLPIEAKSES